MLAYNKILYRDMAFDPDKDLDPICLYAFQPNVLVVRADATEHEGWFYEGAGIYRHVWLVKSSPVHVAPNGTYVTRAHSGGWWARTRSPAISWCPR